MAVRETAAQRRVQGELRVRNSFQAQPGPQEVSSLPSGHSHFTALVEWLLPVFLSMLFPMLCQVNSQAQGGKAQGRFCFLNDLLSKEIDNSLLTLVFNYIAPNVKLAVKY